MRSLGPPDAPCSVKKDSWRAGLNSPSTCTKTSRRRPSSVSCRLAGAALAAGVQDTHRRAGRQQSAGACDGSLQGVAGVHGQRRAVEAPQLAQNHTAEATSASQPLRASASMQDDLPTATTPVTKTAREALESSLRLTRHPTACPRKGPSQIGRGSPNWSSAPKRP